MFLLGILGVDIEALSSDCLKCLLHVSGGGNNSTFIIEC